MKTLKNKLQSHSGASLIIAMLFFLLCATVSAVILTAAAVNLERTGVSYDQNQSYLTLSSAARLVSDQVKPLALNMTREKTHFTCTGDLRCELNPEYAADIEYTDPHLLTTSTTPIGQIVEAAASQVCSGTELYQTEFTVKADIEDNDNLQTVFIKLYMDKFYELSMVLSLDDEDYTPIELVFDPTLNSVETTENTGTYCFYHGEEIDKITETTTVSWNLKYSDIARGGMTLG